MLNQAFTARNVAKFVVQAVIAQKATDLTEDAIVDHTQFEEDDMIVTIGSRVVGWYVADKLKPYSDKAVDRTADFIVAKREARKAKKDTNEEK
jgi:hypothetical protein